ncbi:olfactory receptor 1-like [Gastrophryne carolinensis]
MENQTSIKEFFISPFTARVEDNPIIFASLLLIYLIGLLVNSMVISVINWDPHLHIPLYLFLCNLSIVDICYTTTTVPKLLDILLTGNNAISFRHCFAQLYFFFFVGSAEHLLLFAMAFDRYMAICRPLHYYLTFSKKNCISFVVLIWFSAVLNAIMFTVASANMTFCRSMPIQQLFCDAKALAKIACTGANAFYIVTYVDIVIFAFGPFWCSLTSYVKMISVILKIESKDGRRKAFSTCSSHLTVIIIFYSTSMTVYMMPSSMENSVLEQVCIVMYTAVVPMLNPLIYSLRNKDVKRAMQHLLGIK